MRTLGLDLGTNSIGWAVIDSSLPQPLVAKGVQIFEKGVGEEKNNEFSLASKRTIFRSARRRKRRRKMRKFFTLKVLVESGFCPGLSLADLQAWKTRKIYPANPAFREWLNTRAAVDNQKPVDPYTYRALVANQPLDHTHPENRYILGRALYHMAQRRGYKSNRVSGEDKDGAVSGAIHQLDQERGERTLGQLFKQDYFGINRIRGRYTSRKQYQEEFERICDVQNLPEELCKRLEKAIFLQRPLKSQKGSVGPCLLEKGKPRVAISHPDFERFRALQMINNIRLAEPGSTSFRPMTDEERHLVLAWNLTRAKNEMFATLAKQLTPKKAQRLFGIKQPASEPYAWQFNFREDAIVSECPVNARLSKLFGEEWRTTLRERYTKAGAKTDQQIMEDVWHAMFSFDDPEKLRAFGQMNLGLGEEDSELFARPLRQGYGSLSLAALRKTLPWMEKGLIYSHAVFLANLPTLFRKQGLQWKEHSCIVQDQIRAILDNSAALSVRQGAIREALKTLVAEEPPVDPDTLVMPHRKKQILLILEKQLRLRMGSETWDSTPASEAGSLMQELFDEVRNNYHVGLRAEDLPKPPTIEGQIQDLLSKTYGLSEGLIKHVYHPAAIETYPVSTAKLGSPRIPSIKNPVFMRAMHRLRAVVNELIAQGIVDRETRVRVEMARDLTTANDRKAIYRYQKEREKENAQFFEEIKSLGCAVASEQDPLVLKYRLWKEQAEKCVYTGRQISASAFLSNNPAYDFEHTIPQSRRFDDSQANLTLCELDFNRNIKGSRMPSELHNHAEILERVHTLWKPHIQEHELAIAKARSASRSAGDKDSKDQARQRLHYHQQHLRYWREKIENFETKVVPEGFTNRQLVDTRIITKYATLYLKSYFPHVYSLKASALSTLKEIWGLQVKHRDNHIHHCVDAIIAGVVSPRFYDELAAYYHAHERWTKSAAPKPHAPEPWPGFARYLNEQLVKEVLIVHHQRDLLLKQTHKLLRVRGKIQMNPEGNPIHVRGDSARGSLHQETNYAKVREVPTEEHPEPGELFTVVRKQLNAAFKPEDIEKIVDPVVRGKVRAQKDQIGKETVWFNKDKGIPIRHVRVRCKNDPASLITLREHRDTSAAEHKKHLYVANDNNYILALYRGEVKGKPKGDWKLVSSIEAIRAMKSGSLSELLPSQDAQGLGLQHVLKTGTQVLFYKDSPEELKTLSRVELVRRLYRVTVMEGSRARFNYHSTSKTSGDLGPGSSSISWDSPESELRLNLTLSKANFVVEGSAFNLTTTGEITWRF